MLGEAPRAQRAAHVVMVQPHERQSHRTRAPMWYCHSSADGIGTYMILRFCAIQHAERPLQYHRLLCYYYPLLNRFI
jgi:hypothetical protein